MYVVVSSPKGSTFYTDNITEAEEVYFLKCEQYSFVEILQGEPEHYETIRQNW